jgi:putative FmdB family regulatory protein
MPIYEFVCESCRHAYEAFVVRVGGTAPCPECGSEDVEKAISCPATPSSGTPERSSAPPPCAAGGG